MSDSDKDSADDSSDKDSKDSEDSEKDGDDSEEVRGWLNADSYCGAMFASIYSLTFPLGYFYSLVTRQLLMATRRRYIFLTGAVNFILISHTHTHPFTST